MKYFGFTLNNMTMLALSLATGIVIDDAIVVLENIFRFVEEKGVTPREAAAAATQEIGLAVVATTLSLVVIFLPVAFMTGQVGRYFYSFGITSAAAILHLDVRLLHADAGALRVVAEEGGHGLRPLHDQVAGRVRRDRPHVRPHARVVAEAPRRDARASPARPCASAILVFPYVGKELVPDDDQSEFSVNVNLPKGTSFARTEEYMRVDRAATCARCRKWTWSSPTCPRTARTTTSA